MSNGLLYIAGLIVLVLAALFAGPYFVDWNGYRGVFEEEATRILGRRVRVGGNVNVRLLPEPYVSFDKLKIADPTSTTGDAFFSAESFTMKLSVPPLLKGVLEAKQVVLKKPVLRLAFDADGRGNWSALRITPGTLPFVPADVTLQSVDIEDGTIGFYGPKGREFSRVEGLDGELSAESIEGPFSFIGMVKWRGAQRELRVATAPPDAGGNVRFKANVRGDGRNNFYVVDALISELDGTPRVNGDLTAKLELDPATLPSAAASDGVVAVQGGEKPILDFKAKIAGNSQSLNLDDMTLSFERVGQPQLINGSAATTWSDGLAVDLKFASRWLDLDRIASAGANERPLDIASSIVAAATQALPGASNSKLRFDLDQAALGGETVSDIRVQLAGTNGVLVLQELRAGLPGGTRVALDGEVADAVSRKTFQGDLALRGTSLSRFLSWATKGDKFAEAIQSEGLFSLQGQLGVGDKTIDLVDAIVEAGGNALAGEFHYSGGERSTLALAVEGPEIDARPFWPHSVGYLHRAVLGDGAGKPEDTSQRPGWFDLTTTDLKLQIKTGRLLTGRHTLRDVDLDCAIEQGRLVLPTFRFTANEGLSFNLEGDINEVEGQSTGVLRWILSAPTPGAYSEFIDLIELDGARKAEALRWAGLVPMQLAGAIDFGQRTEASADVSLDGAVQGGRLVADFKFDSGLRQWRQSHADVTVTIQTRDIVRSLSDLGGAPARVTDEGVRRGGEIFLSAIGTPDDGLLASANVQAVGLSLVYEGSVRFPADGGRELDGEMRMAARELSDIMSLAGLGGGGLRGVGIEGELKIAAHGDVIEVDPNNLTIADSKIDGRLSVTRPEGASAVVSAKLDVDEASIPGLLTAVLDRSVTAQVEAEPLTEGKVIWPEHPFDFAALKGVEGKVEVDFGTLSLDQGMAIQKAHLDVALSPDKITVTKLEGRALGGELTATLDVERAAGGATVSGNVQLHGAQLASGSAEKNAEETASLSLEFSGRASTPGALLTVASGKGELKIGEAKMPAPTPFAVVATSEAVLTGEAGGTGEALAKALREQFAAGKVQIGPRVIAIEIADGAAKLAPFTLQSDAGRTAVETTIDLASLVVDSAWLVEPRAPDVEQPDRPRKGALPSLNVVYTGPLKDLWTLEPRVTTGPLERELAIRRMELDAEQLERLHRLDAERARREEERRRAEEERLRAEEERRRALEEAKRARAAEEFAPPGNVFVQPPAPQPASPTTGVPQALPDTSLIDSMPEVPSASPDDVQVGVPGDVDPVTGEPLPPVSGQPAQTAPRQYRRKRSVNRNIPAGEQVLRSLQNFPN